MGSNFWQRGGLNPKDGGRTGFEAVTLQRHCGSVRFDGGILNLYLASNESKFVTGSELVIDGWLYCPMNTTFALEACEVRTLR